MQFYQCYCHQKTYSISNPLHYRSSSEQIPDRKWTEELNCSSFKTQMMKLKRFII